MDESEAPAPRLHPMDVRQLLEEGTITTARIEENSFGIDRDIFDVLFPRLGLKPVDQAVYVQLYRHSFGRGLNCAQLSNTELQRLCNVTHTCIRKAIRRLMEEGCLQIVREGFQHNARIFRVMLPGEVLDYDSATRAVYEKLDTDAVTSRARGHEQPPDYERPIIDFNMVRP
ncbi:MAG: hypothetical protein HQ592_05765 [Planctomycetes bacterium]|nr:hypothetical protein [Planctomycetota bacterium]